METKSKTKRDQTRTKLWKSLSKARLNQELNPGLHPGLNWTKLRSMKRLTKGYTRTEGQIWAKLGKTWIEVSRTSQKTEAIDLRLIQRLNHD